MLLDITLEPLVSAINYIQPLVFILKLWRIYVDLALKSMGFMLWELKECMDIVSCHFRFDQGWESKKQEMYY